MKRRTEAVTIQPAAGLDEYHDFSKPEVLAKYRAALAASNLKDGKLPESIHLTWSEGKNYRLARLKQDGAAQGKLLFHIHGGGWNGGVPCVGQQAMISLQQETGVDMVSVEYPLAPEHPYPQGFDGCTAAYRAILAEGWRGEDIVLIGESAGGNLCLGLALWLKAQKLPMPGGLVLISPGSEMKDLGELKRAAEAHPEDLKLSETYDTYAMYMGNHPRTDPYLSPLFGDYAGFPPMLFQCGGSEFLLEETAKCAAKAAMAGADVRFHSWEFMPHVFMLMTGVLPEAEPARKEIADFVREVLAL